MELRVGQRREIIEDLLDIQVFSVMNLLAKDKINENKAEINDNKYNIELIETKIQSAEENNEAIRKIKETEVDKIRTKMNEHIDEIEGKQTNIDTVDEDIKSLYETISDKKDVKGKFDKANSLKQDMETTRRNFDKELSFYHDNDNCPTCKQGIEHDFKEKVVSEKNDKLQELENGLVEITTKITDYQKRLDSIGEVEEQIQNKNFEISEIRAEIKMAKNALVSFKTELESAEREVEEVDTSKLEALQEDLNIKNSKAEELLREHEILNVVSTILKDGGIKARNY